MGVEREFTLVRDGAAVDARRVRSAVRGSGAALDPGDDNARRDPWGGVVTLDGRHVETATRPVALRPGAVHDVAALARSGALHLAGLLPEGSLLAGYSTHVSVEVDDGDVVSTAHLVARRLSLPLLLALDRPGSPGLLVRPRAGRLEVCAEYVAGEQLRAAVALTVGATLLAQRRVGLARALRGPLRTPRTRPVRAVERFGWFVEHAAFAGDLFTTGRVTRVGRSTAGEVLERVWASSRPLAARLLADDDLAPADALVAGSLPLPLEQLVADDVAGGRSAHEPDRVPGYGPRRRGDLEVLVVVASWWKAVLQLRSPDSTRWVTVPGRTLDAVLGALDRGALDDDLHRLVAAPSG